MKDRRSAVVTDQVEQSRIRLQVGLGLFLSILVVQGAASMMLSDKQATGGANSHNRFAVAELSAH